MKRKREEEEKSDPRVLKKRKKKGFFHKTGEKVNELKDVDEKILRKKENDYYQCMTNSKGRKKSQVTMGEWSHKYRKVRVLDQRGKLASNMGRRIEGKKHLNVFEVMYLIERSLLCVRIPKNEENVESEPEFENLKSVQDSLNFLMKQKDFSLDHFVVFSHLKNLGYLVHEFDIRKFEEVEEEEEEEEKDEDEDDDEEEKPVRKKRKKRQKKTTASKKNLFDDIDLEEFETIEESRGWNTPSQVIQETDKDQNIIQPPPPPPQPKTTKKENVDEKKGFEPLFSFDEKSMNPGAEEIMKSIDIIPQNQVEGGGGDDDDDEGEVELVFNCWKKEGMKGVVPYDKLKKPDFVISITRYSDHFPSFKAIHDVCTKYFPVPVFFGIVESGHVVFMELNCLNISQNI